MLRSLFTGVLGLNAHQKELDIVGDNIANVNTPGFKAGRAVFADMLAQVSRTGSAPAGDGGGQAPLQVGLGVSVEATENDLTQGGLMVTNRPTDLAIDGDGYFVLADGSGKVYTRAGAFRWSADGKLVDQDGRFVLGWLAENGVLGSDRSAAALKPVAYDGALSIGAAQTTKAVLAKNLSATENGSYVPGSSVLNVVMPSGTSVPVTVTLSPTAGFNRWRWSLAGNATFSAPSGYVEFDSSGAISRVTDESGNVIAEITVTSGSDTATINVTGNKSALRFVSGANAVSFSYQPYVHTVQFNAYGPKGELYSVNVAFQKTGDNAWSWSAKVFDQTGGAVPCSSSGTISFDLNGRVVSASGNKVSFATADGAPVEVNLDFSRLTQYAGESTAVITESDGNAPGELESVDIDEKGTVTGVYTNGLSRTIARLALARFGDPGSLTRVGGNTYKDSPASGAPSFGEPKSGGAGSVVSGALEMSNVDLAREFTSMIVAQRGFLANARIITVSDEVLQELANLKR